jgi:hypothetical protein
MFQIEMRRAPGITEQERRRRMHQAYEILLSAARKKMNDAPASELADPERARRTTPAGTTNAEPCYSRT